jgi:hypothetical protein
MFLKVWRVGFNMDIGMFRKFKVKMDLLDIKNIELSHRYKDYASDLVKKVVNATSPQELAAVFDCVDNEYLTSFMNGRMFYNALGVSPQNTDSEYAMQVKEGIYRLTLLDFCRRGNLISKDLADKTATKIVKSI